MLTDKQKDRYARLLAAPGMSEIQQVRLGRARVVVVGGLGNGLACASQLAASGLGCIVIIDGERIEPGDLDGHLIFGSADIGKKKAEVAAVRLTAFNPDVAVEVIAAPLTAHNAEGFLAGAHAVVDALPNWQEKLICSDACMQLGLPFVYAGAIGLSLDLFTMIPGKSACLRCVLAKAGTEDLATLAQFGDLPGPVAGMAGAWQAVQVLKIVADIGSGQGSTLVKYDATRNDFDLIESMGPSLGCPDCGNQHQRR